MAGGDENTGEKTEQATQQRREEFRKSGQVAQSREVTSILILLGVIGVFYFLSRDFLEQLLNLFTQSFSDGMILASRHDEITSALKMAAIKGGRLVLPVFAIVVVAGIGSTVAQIGFMTAWESIEPDLNRINPLNGFKKLFNLRAGVEGLKAIAKITVIGTVAYLILKKEILFTPQIVQLSIAQTFMYMGSVLFKLIGGVAILMGFVAVLDYGFQWWDLERRMKMTKQEIKEEFKQREGDPMIKARIRRIQRELAQKRMMEQVPKADVIITNPTHLAVALKYDRETMAAPVMVAKGADFIAEKIKELARKHNIPIVENKPLARAMFKTLKIGQAIPKTLYNAVAEVLAYVYKIKGKIKQVSEDIAREHGRTL